MRGPWGMYAAVVVALVAGVSGCTGEPGTTASPEGTAETAGSLTGAPEASSRPDEMLDDAQRERIQLAQSTFDELLATAPEERQRFLVSLAEPLSATSFLSLPAEQLKPVEDVYAWNMPPGAPNAITGQTEVHTDDGLLRASDLRDSIIRFLELSMEHMNGKQSRDQLRSYRQLRAALLADSDAVTVSGWSCQCSPAEVMALLGALTVEATAVEASADTGAMPIWPTTAASEAP